MQAFDIKNVTLEGIYRQVSKSLYASKLVSIINFLPTLTLVLKAALLSTQ
jgi:hypothetical protein